MSDDPIAWLSQSLGGVSLSPFVSVDSPPPDSPAVPEPQPPARSFAEYQDRLSTRLIEAWRQENGPTTRQMDADRRARSAKIPPPEIIARQSPQWRLGLIYELKASGDLEHLRGDPAWESAISGACHTAGGAQNGSIQEGCGSQGHEEGVCSAVHQS